MANSSRIEQIKEMLKDQPDDPFLRYALALEEIERGNDDRAEDIFKELIHKNEDYHATYYHLAKLYERKGEEDLAVETYEKGLEITKGKGERHAFNELRSALDELLFD
ncbi:tetratricopeptide repeat protein [bacterium]|nr:tetratricopeptide repeat protein [bacterium]